MPRPRLIRTPPHQGEGHRFQGSGDLDIAFTADSRGRSRPRHIGPCFAAGSKLPLPRERERTPLATYGAKEGSSHARRSAGMWERSGGDVHVADPRRGGGGAARAGEEEAAGGAELALLTGALLADGKTAQPPKNVVHRDHERPHDEGHRCRRCPDKDG
ncbi:unnamed protein product [Lampetra planeri]